MARFTLYMQNGKEIDFESQSFKLTLDPKTRKITDMEYNKKDKGMSLMYVDYNEVVGITRDTRKEDDL